MKEFFSTSKVTGSSGSSFAIASLLHADDDVEIFVHFRFRAWRHHGGGVDLLDDRGAVENEAAGQVLALEHRRVAGLTVEPDRTPGDGFGRDAGRLMDGEFSFGHDADCFQVEAEEADRR